MSRTSDSVEYLTPPWAACLTLAIEAFSAGSLAIASVITNEEGVLIGKGRNQLFDRQPSGNVIVNTVVSHAEMNALASLPAAYREDKNLSIYATVEPCPMCMGAIAMSPIRKVYVAARDPWAGSIAMLSNNDYLKRKNITVEFASGTLEEVFFCLHMMSDRKHAKNSLDHPFYAVMERRYPRYYRRLDQLEADKVLMNAIAEKEEDVVLRRIWETTNKDDN